MSGGINYIKYHLKYKSPCKNVPIDVTYKVNANQKTLKAPAIKGNVRAEIGHRLSSIVSSPRSPNPTSTSTFSTP
jgi:hypothetical protein